MGRCTGKKLSGTWRRAIALVFLAALTGCADMRLHSPTRDKQGDVAKDAWGKVDVKGQLAGARELQANILAREKRVLETTAANYREALIVQISHGASLDSSAISALKDAMQRLAGTNTYCAKADDKPPCQSPAIQNLGAWLAGLEKEKVWADRYAQLAFNLSRVGLELPSCTSWEKDKTAALAPFNKWLQSRPAGDMSSSLVADVLRDAEMACASPNRKASALARGQLGGQLQTLAVDAEKAVVDLAAMEEAGKKTRNDYAAAKSAYEGAEAKLKVDSTAAADAKDAAAKLEKAAKAVMGLNGLFNEKFLSEMRRDSLERFLGGLAALGEDKELPADSGRFLVALDVLPKLLDKTDQSLLDARKPLLVPLVMRRDQERIKVETLARDIASLKLHEQLLRQQLVVAAKRVGLLLPGLEYFDTMLPPTQRAMSLDRAVEDMTARAQAEVDKKVEALQKSKLPEKAEAIELAKDAGKAKAALDRLIMYRALSALLYAEGTLEGQQRQLRFQDEAIEYERSVSYAEGAVLQWHALIDTSVAQLDAYAKSGIKPETLTGLVNALGVLWIGYGVNK